VISYFVNETLSKKLNECQDVADEENDKCHSKLFQFESNPIHQLNGLPILVVLQQALMRDSHELIHPIPLQTQRIPPKWSLKKVPYNIIGILKKNILNVNLLYILFVNLHYVRTVFRYSHKHVYESHRFLAQCEETFVVWHCFLNVEVANSHRLSSFRKRHCIHGLLND